MKITLTTLAEAIHEGRGIGVGDGYRPWIEVTRRLSSPFSNLNVVPVPHLRRLTHYLSRGEREFALLMWWLGATDVREQYPLWPWKHLHPAIQLGGEAGFRYHPGMRDLAKEAGIPLNNYPGSKIPLVLSIDLMVTVPESIAGASLVGISCKPKDVFEKGAPSDRELERLELDRRYCLHAGIPHRLSHPEQISSELLVQLHWLAPIESLATLTRFIDSLQYRKYIELLNKTGFERPAWIASKEAGKHVGWARDIEQRAMHIAIWYQHVDVDVQRHINTTQPLIPGGVALRAQLQKKWLTGAS